MRFEEWMVRLAWKLLCSIDDASICPDQDRYATLCPSGFSTLRILKQVLAQLCLLRLTALTFEQACYPLSPLVPLRICAK